MRGKELDTQIEHELQLMLIEGFDKSPISAKSLHARLKSKGIINGGLSTLSNIERKTSYCSLCRSTIIPS